MNLLEPIRTNITQQLLLGLVLATIAFTHPVHAQQGSSTQNDDVYVIAGQSNAVRLFNNSGVQLALNDAGRRGRVVTTSRGTTGFQQVAGLDWNVSSRGELYDRLVDQINSLKSSSDIKSVIWVQGENDARINSIANRYEARLRRLINRLRADTGIRNLHFVIVQLSSRMPAAERRGTPWTIVRGSQARLARAMNNVDLLRVDSLIRANGFDIDDEMAFGAFLEDTIHWNALAAELIGRRALALILGN